MATTCPVKPCKLPAGHLGYHDPDAPTAPAKKATARKSTGRKATAKSTPTPTATPTSPAPAGDIKE